MIDFIMNIAIFLSIAATTASPSSAFIFISPISNRYHVSSQYKSTIYTTNVQHTKTCSHTNNNLQQRFNELCLYNSKSEIDNDSNSIDRALLKTMNILSANFKSHALHAFVQLNIPNIMGDRSMSIDQIATELSKSADLGGDSDRHINKDALLRTMRLLKMIDVVNEEYVTTNFEHDVLEKEEDTKDVLSSSLEIEILKFQLTSYGKLLQSTDGSKHGGTGSNISSCILHWMEKPLDSAWHKLPDYILGDPSDPFTQTNGLSSDYFYNINDNPQSLEYANDFVKLISDIEIQSIVKYFDWSALDGKTIVDIGGYNGKVLGEIASHYPNTRLTLKSLDLPQVISSIDKSTIPTDVELIEGDVMKPSTIPPCDVIFMKHFLDRCMWTEEETVNILKTCSNIISGSNGMIILGEAVIPSGRNEEANEEGIRLSLDALYMLVGRERQRTRFEWKDLAERANLQISEIIATSSASCYVLVLTNKT